MLRRRSAWQLVLVMLVATLAFGRLVAGAHERPQDADVVAAANALKAVLGPDDVVVVAPPWSFAPLKALGPNAAHVVAADHDGWPSLVRGRGGRVWLWLEDGGEPWQAPMGSNFKEAQPLFAVDGLKVVPLEAGPAVRPSFDLRRAVGRVRMETSDGPCAVVAGVVRCPKVRGAALQRRYALVTENGADVVVVQLQQSPITLSVDEVMLGDVLVLAAGLPRRNGGVQRPDPVWIDVVVDEVILQTIRVAPGDTIPQHRRLLHDTLVGTLDDDAGFRVHHLDTTKVRGARQLRLSIRTAIGASIDGGELGLDLFVPSDVDSTVDGGHP